MQGPHQLANMLMIYGLPCHSAEVRIWPEFMSGRLKGGNRLPDEWMLGVFRQVFGFGLQVVLKHADGIAARVGNEERAGRLIYGQVAGRFADRNARPFLAAGIDQSR